MEPVSESTTTVVVDELERALAGLDFDHVKKTYWEQNEFVCLERWLPASIVERMVAEVERVRPAIHRNYIPRHKKGGSVSYYALVEHWNGSSWHWRRTPLDRKDDTSLEAVSVVPHSRTMWAVGRSGAMLRYC